MKPDGLYPRVSAPAGQPGSTRPPLARPLNVCWCLLVPSQDGSRPCQWTPEAVGVTRALSEEATPRPSPVLHLQGHRPTSTLEITQRSRRRWALRSPAHSGRPRSGGCRRPPWSCVKEAAFPGGGPALTLLPQRARGPGRPPPGTLTAWDSSAPEAVIAGHQRAPRSVGSRSHHIWAEPTSL